MFTDLATPHKINYLVGKGTLSSKEDDDWAATLNNLDMSILSEDNIKDFLV